MTSLAAFPVQQGMKFTQGMSEEIPAVIKRSEFPRHAVKSMASEGSMHTPSDEK